MGCAASTVDISDGSIEVPNFAYTDDESLPPKEPVKVQVKDIPNTTVNSSAIAIIGLGCKTPGAENIRDFWRLLVNGENHIGDIPATRWNADAFYDPDPMVPGKAYVKRAGFVQNPEEFDNTLFGINDFECSSMDPQQRFVLECTHMALEDAGITSSQISGSKTGVYIGSMTSDYRTQFVALTSHLDTYTVTGISNCVLAARVSFLFNLLGPSIVVDTGCSSSLIGMHLGCQSLLSGETDMAICGGVNYMASPEMFVHLSKARMISPTGQCHAFSANADGYTRGEGCGIVILKRLNDAMRDGDKVWATIVTGVNQDGHTVTPMTAPSAVQQKALLNQIYSKFKMDPSKVQYIEAHGTGTEAGDPVEVNSLGTFFKESSTSHIRYIGSVKTNIGHLEAAAGVIGVIKVLLMMKHSTIVPSLHSQVINPKINLKDLHLSVPQTTLKWDQSDKVACCNSFGIGGTNAHLVLMEYKTNKQTNRVDEESYSIVCFSACTRRSLKGIVEDVYHYENLLDLHLQDLSFTSTVRRNHYLYRLAIVSKSMHDLFNATARYLATENTSVVPKQKPHVIFVFCGMATSWNGMCQQLMAEYPVFKSRMEEVNALLLQFVTWSLIDRIYKEDPSRDPEFSPIAIFACQVSLAALWSSLGVGPSSVVGQSVGEVAAAYIAGCMSLADAVKIIYFRSKALAQVTGGKMIVLKNMNVHKVERFLEQYKGKACISLEYSPTSCAVSGDAITTETICKDIMKQIKEKNHVVQIIDLPAPVAYHSQYVDPCKQQLAQSLKGLKTNPPKIDFISSVTGMPLISAPDIPYWIDNLRNPVLFNQAVQMSCKNKTQAVFLEIGPKPVLRSHLKDIFPDDNLPVIASMSKQPEKKIFLEAVASMYEMGVDIMWRNLPFRNVPQMTDVPRYALDKKKLLVKTEIAALILGGVDIFANTHPYTFHLKSNEFKMVFSPLCSKFIYDHMVAGRIVIPGVVYVEASLAIAKHMYNGFPNPSQAVVSVHFQNLVLVQKDELVELMVRQIQSPESKNVPYLEFSVQKDKTLIANMQIHYISIETSLPEILSLEHIRSKCSVHVSKKSIYADLGKLGFSYEKSFTLLDSAQKNVSEALVLLNVIPEVYKESKFMTIHPCILDCMIQTSVVLVKESARDKEQMLPKSISGVKVYGKMEMSMLVHTILKAEKPTQIEYNITLLSLEGRVIAQINDFVMSKLFAQNTADLTDLFCMKWSPVADVREPDGHNTDFFSVILTNIKISEPLNSQKIVSIGDTGNRNAEWEPLPENVKVALEESSRLSVLVLVIHIPLNSDIDSDSLEARLVNMCGLIQRVLKQAIAVSLSVPILICTFNACPINEDLIANECTNPLAASWCGLIRALISEYSYPRLLTVDMHVLPSELTASCLDSIIQTVLNDDDIMSNGELIFRNNKLFSNKITRIDQNISVPVYRDISPDFNNDVVMMSQEADTISNPVGICRRGHLSHPTSEEYTVIKANVFGIPPVELLKMKGPCDRRLDCNLHPVLALESVGEEVSQAGNQLISCCPVEVGTNVRILKNSTIPASVLPDYHLGDLTKLAVLWALQDKVSKSGMTILASKTNKGLAEVLKLILTTQNKSRDVEIEMLESLTLAKSLNETMICLIYLDSHLMSFIASKWQNAHTLITCSFCMTKEAQSTLTYTLPQTEVCLVDNQLLFSHFSLNRTIPDLSVWLQNREKDTFSTIVNLLHSDTQIQMEDGVKTGPIQFSLQLQPVTMDNLQFKARRENLFTQNSVHIVVGGLTGLGWICVQYLVRNGAGNIALLQRRQPSDENRANINTLERKFHCHIYVIQADVTSIDSLKQAFVRIGQIIPNVQVKGIFFGAAVIRDGLFLNMDRSVFSEVVAPKIKGTWNLHLLTRHLPLDYFVMHSSVISILGNAGQSNYCVGNAFMDGLAYYRRKLGLAAQTINWGALDTGLLDNNTKARQNLESRGFLFMTQTDIEDKLDTMLMLNWPQTVAVKLSLERFSESLQGDHFTPLRMRLRGLIIPSNRPKMETDNTEIQLAKRMEPTQRLQTCVKYVTRQTCMILFADESTVSPDVRLKDLGLDSISVQMMTTQIYKDTECQLPHVTFFAENATVRTVAETMSSMLVSRK